MLAAQRLRDYHPSVGPSGGEIDVASQHENESMPTFDGTPLVYVVDDDESIRATVRRVAESAGLEVRAFESPGEFLAQVDRERPACLVLDVHLPEMDGHEVQERLNAAGFALPIIVFTAHAEVPGAVRAMRAGAVDYIQKPFSAQALLDRIQDAARQAVTLHAEHKQRAAVAEQLATLSWRENQVLQGLSKGLANKQIAAQLELSEKTVEVYRARLMKKLGVRTIAELVRIVLSAPSAGTPPQNAT